MQDFRRVEAQQVADRRDGGSQDDEDDEDGDEADDDGHEGDRRVEDHVADRLGQREASAVAEDAAHQADDDRLRQEQRDGRPHGNFGINLLSNLMIVLANRSRELHDFRFDRFVASFDI